MTISGLMIYALVITLLLASGAWLLERALSRVGQPTRHVWLGALTLSLALPAVAPLRGPDAVPAAPATSVEIGAATAPVTAVGELEASSGVLASALDAWDRWTVTLDQALRSASAIVPADSAVEAWIVGSWSVGSLLLAVVVFSSMLRVRHRARAGSPETILGRPVRISSDLGPATIGLVAPDIVLPRWIRELPSRELDLVLAHEEEHARSRDPLLLVMGVLPVIAFPWNPMMWWQLGRLRDAVEVDCDRRVLRRGVAASSYGDLLLKLRARSRVRALLAPTMSSSPSLLERRLSAMRTTRLRNMMPSATASAIGALALVAMACGTEPPSATEQLGVVEAETAEEIIRLRVSSDGTVYVNDEMHSLEDVAEVLGALASASDGTPVLAIFGDQDVPYRVMDRLQQEVTTAGVTRRVVFAPPSATPRGRIFTSPDGRWSTLMHEGLAIVLPEAGMAVPVSGKNLLHLVVQPDGIVDVRRGQSEQVERYAPADVESLWRAEVASNPNLIAAVKTHPEAGHVHMLAVLDALQAAEAQRISLQVLREPAASQAEPVARSQEEVEAAVR